MASLKSVIPHRGLKLSIHIARGVISYMDREKQKKIKNQKFGKRERDSIYVALG